jgi:hypothetical protein
MNDIVVSLIVIAVTVVVVILIFVFANRSKTKKAEQLAQAAKEHGWLFTPIKERLASGFKMETSRWVYEVLSKSIGIESDSGSSNMQLTTKWSSKTSVNVSGFMMMGPRPGSTAPGAIGEMLIQKAFSMFLGADVVSSGKMEEFKGGHPLLLKRWMIWSNKPSMVDEIFTQELERGLENWKGKQLPVIKISKDGIHFEFANTRLEKIEEISSVTGLGELFLRTMDPD